MKENDDHILRLLLLRRNLPLPVRMRSLAWTYFSRLGWPWSWKMPMLFLSSFSALADSFWDMATVPNSLSVLATSTLFSP
jgi:hypothetical protein